MVRFARPGWLPLGSRSEASPCAVLSSSVPRSSPPASPTCRRSASARRSRRTSVAAGATLQGVDVSVYDGDVDWAQVKSSGRAFGIAKATEGSSLTDAEFATNWPAMKSAGIVRSAYHFFHCDTDPATQASFFLGVMGALEPGDLPPSLDFEDIDDVHGRGRRLDGDRVARRGRVGDRHAPHPLHVGERAEQFRRRAEPRGPRAALGREPRRDLPRPARAVHRVVVLAVQPDGHRAGPAEQRRDGGPRSVQRRHERLARAHRGRLVHERVEQRERALGRAGVHGRRRRRDLRRHVRLRGHAGLRRRRRASAPGRPTSSAARRPATRRRGAARPPAAQGVRARRRPALESGEAAPAGGRDERGRWSRRLVCYVSERLCCDADRAPRRAPRSCRPRSCWQESSRRRVFRSHHAGDQQHPQRREDHRGDLLRALRIEQLARAVAGDDGDRRDAPQRQRRRAEHDGGCA